MEYTCPVCQGSIIIERISDGITTVRVQETGELREFGCKSNGSISVHCEKDRSHEIPQDQEDRLIEIFNDHY